MAVSTTTASELIPTQVARLLVKPLEAKSKFLAAGPQIFDTAAPLKLPKLGAAVTDPGFTAENTAIPERDVDFGEVSLLPSTMDSIKVITRFSNEFVRQSVIAIDAAIQQRLVKDVADRLDSQLFSATGDGVDTPRGIFAYAGTQNHVVPSGAITFDVLLEAERLAAVANVDITSDSVKWLFDTVTYYRLRTIKTATSGSNEYLLQPSVTKPGAYTIFGHEVIVTDRVPIDLADTPDTRRAALVDFSQIAVARDLAPSVTFLRERYADFDQAAIRVVARYDAAPLNPAAIVTLTDILL